LVHRFAAVGAYLGADPEGVALMILAVIAAVSFVYTDTEICIVDDGRDWRGNPVYIAHRTCHPKEGGMLRTYRDTGDGRTCMRLEGQWPECCYTPTLPLYEGLGGRWICERGQCHE
jgi:hypothetical protein